jgi:2-iminobutanoate/2-iminopropanoate deaminase
MITYVSTPRAPAPAGHYSQATIYNGIVYVSGQLPIDPATGAKNLGSIEEQTEQVLQNLVAVLEEAGSDLDQVLKVTVYLADLGLWDRVNAVYARFFGDGRPARSVVPTQPLHHGFLIEIDAVAAASRRP